MVRHTQGEHMARSIDSIALQDLRSWALGCHFIVRIPQRTVLQGKAAAADAKVQLISQIGGQLDLFLKLLIPKPAHLLPIFLRRCTVSRHVFKCLFDFLQGKAKSLRHFDKGQDPELAPREDPMVFPIPDTVYQLLGFVEVNGRNRDSAATGHFPDGKQIGAFSHGSVVLASTSSKVEAKRR